MYPRLHSSIVAGPVNVRPGRQGARGRRPPAASGSPVRVGTPCDAGAANGAAAPFGRTPRFSVSFRPILGPTQEQAWERARDILARILAARGGRLSGPARPQAVGSLRLLKFAAEGEIHDRRLWTPIAAATGTAGNTTALVGTPDEVAESLLAYYDAGVTTLLIRGFNPLQDAIDYGRDLIPLVRAEVARRDRQTAAV
jgi:alkanesulfonate monooxygenase